MKNKLLFLIVVTGIATYCFITAFAAKTDSTENEPPKVSITTTAVNNRFQWNAVVNYTITVSDKEDGTSEYNEIATNEVLLKVVFLRDSSKIKKYLSDKAKNNDIQSTGLSFIKTSGCFSCHTAKNKLIGPSFELIAKRYPNNATSIAMLTKKIMQGSTDVWGSATMPAHLDLKPLQAKEIVSWILKNNTNPDVNYFAGIQGAFHTTQKPEKDARKGVYILTASYTDHGLKNLPQLSKHGLHTIVLKSY